MSTQISGTSGVIFPDASTQNTAATGFGFKNRIINGAMMIDQRNAGAASANTINGYFLDRWQVLQQTATPNKLIAQQNAGSITPPAGFSKYLGVTSQSSFSVPSGENFSIYQAIEAFNTADFGWGTGNAKPITLSAWVYSSITGTFGGALSNSSVNRSYPFTYSIPVANTWTQISVTIAGDTTGTWDGATNSIGIRVWFGLGTGSTYSGTAGSWASADYRSATGATSVVGTNGATFYITGVQLEKGSTATSFDYRPYGTELALCQRYYQNLTPDSKRIICAGYTGSGAFNYITVTYPVVLRASATPILSSFSNGNSGNATVNGVCSSNVEIVNQVTTTGFGYSSFYATVSAEL